jgi:hypothetical protein
MVSAPETFPALQFTSPVEVKGGEIFTMPFVMFRVSPDAGTAIGVQLVELYKSDDTASVHVRVAPKDAAQAAQPLKATIRPHFVFMAFYLNARAKLTTFFCLKGHLMVRRLEASQQQLHLGPAPAAEHGCFLKTFLAISL